MQAESPKRTVAANVRFDFNDFDFAPWPVRHATPMTIPAIA